MKLYNYTSRMGIKKIPAKNRYAQIHLYFRILAQEKLGTREKGTNVNNIAKQVKDYWKSFYSVDSLTQLSDVDLQRLTMLIQNRIKTLKKLKT